MSQPGPATSWLFVHRTECHVAGLPVQAPIYRFTVNVPEGQIDDQFVPAINRDIMQAVVEAEGGTWPHPERRLWITVHEVHDGRWGSGGRQLHLKQVIDVVSPGWGDSAVKRHAERFPGAKIVATPGVVSYIESHVGQDVKTWSAMFGDDAVTPSAVPSPLGAVVAGDVAYNQIHQMLGFGGPAEWAKWIESIDAIERLCPRVVVAGHKKPGAADDDAAGILNGTRAYIRDFAEAAGSAGLVEGLVGAMRAKHPDHGNLTTLLFSASAAFKGRTRP